MAMALPVGYVQVTKTIHTVQHHQTGNSAEASASGSEMNMQTKLVAMILGIALVSTIVIVVMSTQSANAFFGRGGFGHGFVNGITGGQVPPGPYCSQPNVEQHNSNCPQAG